MLREIWTTELLIKRIVRMELMVKIRKGRLDQEQIAGEIRHGITKASFYVFWVFFPHSFACFSNVFG